jgi:hypothetical protein
MEVTGVAAVTLSLNGQLRGERDPTLKASSPANAPVSFPGTRCFDEGRYGLACWPWAAAGSVNEL